MAVTIQTRRDDATDWATANPVLALGEIGIETDTNKAKYGDGFTNWNDLPYWIDEGAQIPDGTADGQTLRYNLTDDGWEASSALVVDSSGNVGIGTDAPTTRLSVFDASGGTISLGVTGSGERARMAYVGGNGLFEFTTPAGAGFAWDMDGTERMRIDSAGNVGIGTAAPTTTLEVEGQIQVAYDGSVTPRVQVTNYAGQTVWAMDVASNDNCRLRALDGNATIQIGHVSQTGTGVLSFITNAAEAARIDSSGNLLVGQTTPLRTSTGAFIRPNASSGFYAAGSIGMECGRTDTDGAVQGFYIAGVASGGITTTSGGTPSFYAAGSDERLKTNITDHENTLDQVNAIRTVRFDWADGSGSGEGVVAQELQQIWPDCVHEIEQEDGNPEGYLTVSGFDQVTTRLVKAIQELTARVEQLENA